MTPDDLQIGKTYRCVKQDKVTFCQILRYIPWTKGRERLWLVAYLLKPDWNGAQDTIEWPIEREMEISRFAQWAKEQVD